MCPPMTSGASARASKLSPDEQRWRAESDYNALDRAEEIRADKSRHTAAIGHAQKQLKRIKKIAVSGRGRSRR
jgi:hypothetical protein